MPYVKKHLMPSANSAYANRFHKAAIASPLVLVNLVAFSGQYGFAHDHLKSWGILGDAVFAIALESIALFLSYEAFLAETRNDSAMRLKLMSYLYGFMVGTINYSHWAYNWHPNAIAIVVGMMSVSSPILWGIYSRSVSRVVLLSQGLIDPHALRLGATRWMFHPIRSFQVMHHATWLGINTPDKAIKSYEDQQEYRELERMNGKARPAIDGYPDSMREFQAITGED